MIFVPTASSAAGLTPPSPTQSASGTSIGTGMAVLALTDSGTRRTPGTFMTADCSEAFAKIGPVMVGGSRVLETLESWVAMTASPSGGESVGFACAGPAAHTEKETGPAGS